MFLKIAIVILLSLTPTLCTSVNVTSALILTPLIHQNRLEEARNASLVNSSLFLNITSHAGFLTVDDKYNSNLYFWYFPVSDKPVNETPWIIWLQGGPGDSSLVGLFNEVGPFEYIGGKLKRRQGSWSGNYSILFVDNPVGAGFSFTDSRDGFVESMETCSRHLYSALQQFLTVFPELRGAPLYIAGESYAGRYTPGFGFKILQENLTGNATVNLMGLMVSNPVVDPIDLVDLTSVYYHWGLLDKQGLLAAEPLQVKYRQAVEQNNSAEAWSLRDQLQDFLQDISQHTNRYNLLGDPGDLKTFETLFDQPGVREALHVSSIQFTFSNRSVDTALRKNFLEPITPKLEKLLEHYKIMVYCGQLDLTAPCQLGADSRRKRWHWSRRDDFLKAPRRPWTYNGTVAGYVKEGGGLTEVLVLAVPLDAPAAARSLLAHFVSGDELHPPGDYVNKPQYTPPYNDDEIDEPTPTAKKSDALIASVVVNVLLLICLLGTILLFVKYRRRTEAFFYSTVEDSISDGILTMT